MGSTTIAYIGIYFEWNVTAGTMTKYYYEGSVRVAVRTGTATPTYLLSDQLGSTEFTVDGSGNNATELRYKPWGEIRYPDDLSGIPTNYRFTGQPETPSLGDTPSDGLDFYQSRWLDPTLGRFISADTVTPVKSQGVQAYDRYAYAGNSPVVNNDPSGHCPVDTPAEMQGACDANLMYGSGSWTEGGPGNNSFPVDSYWQGVGDPDVTDSVSPSQIAADAQLKAGYKIDAWGDAQLPKGTLVVQGSPGSSNFYTSLDTLNDSGMDAQNFYEGLQVSVGDFPTYRANVKIGILETDVLAAQSAALANTDSGDDGGSLQFYIPDSKTVVTPITEMPMSNLIPKGQYQKRQ